MSVLLKEKIRSLKEDKNLELKRQSLKRKLMQKDLSNSWRSKSQEDISYKEQKITTLLNEENSYMNRNSGLIQRLKLLSLVF